MQNCSSDQSKRPFSREIESEIERDRKRGRDRDRSREKESLIMDKIDTHLKRFWSNDKRNTELPFPSIKQEAEHFIYSNI